MKNLNDGYVYFIQCDDNGPIKIGYSKYESAEARLTTAQVYNPMTLKLLCIMPGGRNKEKELHEKFNNFHIHGEWFYPNEELLILINSLVKLNLTVSDFRRNGPAHESHHFWGGEEATDSSKRSRVIRRYKIDNDTKCQSCNKEKAIERYHKDRDLNNISSENIIFVCRKCCMKLDGRLDKLASYIHKVLPPQKCIICRQFKKPLRKGRCHTCNEYYRRTNKERYEIL